MKRVIWTWFDGKWVREQTSEMSSGTCRGKLQELRFVTPGRFDVSGAVGDDTVSGSTCHGKPNLYVTT